MTMCLYLFCLFFFYVFFFFFFLCIRRPPIATLVRSSAAWLVYKGQACVKIEQSREQGAEQDNRIARRRNVQIGQMKDTKCRQRRFFGNTRRRHGHLDGVHAFIAALLRRFP